MAQHGKAAFPYNVSLRTDQSPALWHTAHVLELLTGAEGDMVTMVGTQSVFSEAIKELLQLEYDASEAYEAAIKRINSPSYKEELTAFLADHHSHIHKLKNLLMAHRHIPPAGPSLGKQWLTKGKVVFGALLGDMTILEAMRSNETDTNTAYERVNAREDKWEDARLILNEALQDEKRHKAWLDWVCETDGEENK